MAPSTLPSSFTKFDIPFQLDRMDFDIAIQRGQEIIRTITLESTDLTEVMSSSDNPEVKGLAQNYFFIYVELLRQVDQAFIQTIASSSAEDQERVREYFLDLIDSTPIALFDYLKKDRLRKITDIPPETLDLVIDDLVKNLEVINKELPACITTVFEESESVIAKAFAALAAERYSNQPLTSVDDIGKSISQLCHQWIEEKDSEIQSVLSAIINFFNKPSSETKVVPELPPEESNSTLFAEDFLFSPLRDTSTNLMLAFPLLAKMHDIIDQKVPADNPDNKKLKEVATLFFYTPFHGLAGSMKGFTDLIENANIIVFAMNKIREAWAKRKNISKQ